MSSGEIEQVVLDPAVIKRAGDILVLAIGEAATISVLLSAIASHKTLQGDHVSAFKSEACKDYLWGVMNDTLNVLARHAPNHDWLEYKQVFDVLGRDVQ
ncbi:hypothetical protein [Fundidesulfovibrio agrisoli]|uniref:hypothetical protein n=1 Tax=Fundidesulfovibrio agrisoli TaxID=2922717 RepID=UPI001FAD4A70|nr:hypothetical protein [Fundidesulfovibrio agrisoli]